MTGRLVRMAPCAFTSSGLSWRWRIHGYRLRFGLRFAAVATMRMKAARGWSEGTEEVMVWARQRLLLRDLQDWTISPR